MAVHARAESDQAVTRAQTLFVVALTVVATGIVGFGLYVVSSTMWGDRWYPGGRRGRSRQHRAHRRDGRG
jgi:hypothetical protein